MNTSISVINSITTHYRVQEDCIKPYPTSMSTPSTLAATRLGDTVWSNSQELRTLIMTALGIGFSPFLKIYYIAQLGDLFQLHRHASAMHVHYSTPYRHHCTHTHTQTDTEQHTHRKVSPKVLITSYKYTANVDILLLGRKPCISGEPIKSCCTHGM